MVVNPIGRISKYVLLEKLGEGGFGVVYLAEDDQLGVRRAIKILHAALLSDISFHERFRKEARITARLKHPHIVQIYDLGEDAGRLFLAMEYLPGGSLKELLARNGVLNFEQTLRIVTQISSALDYAFAQPEQIIHRDLKPGNILFDEAGKAYLCDFGLARMLMGGDTSTSSTSMIGTPHYMAIELWRGQPASSASDVYALACVVYEMLTGVLLFPGNSPAEVITRHVVDGPRLPEVWPTAVPSGLNKILLQALSPDPSTRPATAGIFAQMLAELIQNFQGGLIKEKQEEAKRLEERHQAEEAKRLEEQHRAEEAKRLEDLSKANAARIKVEEDLRVKEVQNLTLRADHAMKRNEWREAYRLLQQALKLEPKHPQTLSLMDQVKPEVRRISRRQLLIAGGGLAAVACIGGSAMLINALNFSPDPTQVSSAIQETEPTPVPVPTKTAMAEVSSKPTSTPLTSIAIREKVWPRKDIPRNRTLVYSNGSMTPGLCSPLVTGFNHQNGHAILWEPAAYYGAHADKTYLWLAESYQYNDNATEITIKFRQGIKWSDGTPFNASDVATSMERLKRVDGLNRSATYKAEMEATEVVDDLTLKIKFNQTDWRFFFNSLTFRFDLGDDTGILPEHIYKDIPDAELVNFKNFDVEKQWPVTTSAYGCSQATDQFTTFDLRSSWWAVESGFVEKEPDVWRLLQQPFQNETLAVQQLINNEIDQSLDLSPMVVVSLLAQSDHVTTWTGNNPPFGYTDWWPISVFFNTMQAPTNDPKVRWAISYAINRQQLVDVAWGGAGKVSATPFPEFAKLDTMVAGIKDITDQYNILQQDLNKSANLMTEAGYAKNADGFWVDKDGNLPNFDLYGAVPLFGDLAPLIAEQLRAAGFKCEHKAPQDVWDAMADGRANLFLFGHGGATIDPLDTFMLYREENAMAVGSPSWANLSRWSDPKFTEITDRMKITAMDDYAMQQLFHDGMAVWYENLPDAPIVQWFHRIPVNTTYWSNWPTADNPYMNSALWHQTMFIVINGLKATGA